MTSQEIRIKELITAVGTDWKNIWAAIGDMDLDTSASDLTNAINEILAIAGGTLDFDDLTDVVLTGPTTGHIPRHNGTNWINVLGTTYFEVAGAAAAAQAAAIAASQPVDSDLTSIAALSTTSYGRAILELANQAALMALIAAASDTAAGKVELATDAETITGTDTARATTPANIAAVFTDRIDTNAALGSSNTKVPSQAAVKSYADALIGAMNVLRFAGTIDCSASPNYPAGDAGDLYVVSVAGKIGGVSGYAVEPGDLIICLVDGTTSGDHAAKVANWDIVQVNIIGGVTTASGSSVNNDFVTMSGTSGKVVQDSFISFDTDGLLAANSDNRIPSQKAVKAFAQPADPGLAAIANLATNSYGRALLTLANQAGLMALIAAASETASGIIEIATQSETNTGTDDVRAVTPLKFQTRLAAYAQPLDSDLTSIAALTTTSYGRAFLELANQAALMGLVQAASETVAGKIEIATQGETNTGTDDTRAITPAKLSAYVAAQIGTSIAGASIDALNDVDTTTITPADPDMLVWNDFLGAWEPVSANHDAPTVFGVGTLLSMSGFADIAISIESYLSGATESNSGKIEIATQAETNAGSDDVRAITPAKLASNRTTVFGTVDTDYAAYYTAAKA